MEIRQLSFLGIHSFYVVVQDLKVNLLRRGASGSIAWYSRLELNLSFARVLHLADLSAPRLGTSTREDEVINL
jgi:hypothetical protein